MDGKSIFVFRHDHRLAPAREAGVVALGWHALSGLDQAPEWDAIKADMIAKYPDLYAGNPRGLGNAAGSVWRFAREMKVGDWVLIPASGAFFVAEIESGVQFNSAWADDDMAWHRRARWLAPEPIARVSVGNALQMRLKSRQTIVDATDCTADVEARIEGRSLPTLVQFVRERSREAIIHALTEISNPDQLERLVADLLRAQGAVSAKVPSKNQRLPGDFDVVAEWPPIAPGARGLKVAAQVKQHEGESGVHGVRQLIDRHTHEPEVDRLLFVTTAANVSKEARDEADRAGISVITRDDLADWISNKGLDALVGLAPA